MRHLLFVCTAALLVVSAEAADAVQWSRWELALDGATASVAFSGPGGRRVEPPGFTSGDRTIFRVAFPAAGKWTWKASSGKTGEVRVEKYSGRNPLYRHGFLKVADSKRHLAHADGAPFLWMGDTAWYAGVKATPEEWRTYLADRVAKGFSVVHISATRGPAIQPERPPFQADGQPNGAYWDNLDAKVRLANESGLAVLMVGLGRPVPEHEPLVARPDFARYIAARFYGDHVIFSPNFDGPYAPLLDTVAENLRSFTSVHLISQHPGTRKGWTEVYVPKSYLDFSALQSGHHNGRLDVAYTAARDWPRDLWSMTPVKPVINVEGMYDGRGSDEGAGWRAKDVRKIGWISWLSGALGYSYGAGETDRKVKGSNGGIWGWNQNESAWDSWRKTMTWDSSRQMKVLREFFGSLEWWRLEPAQEAMLEPAEAPTERPVFSAAADGSFAVAYTPIRSPIRIDMKRFKGPVQAIWIDPLTGAKQGLPGRISNSEPHTFTPPESGEDWALLLKR